MIEAAGIVAGLVVVYLLGYSQGGAAATRRHNTNLTELLDVIKSTSQTKGGPK